MTLLLKTSWLRDLLLERLRNADKFPTDLATKSGRPMQIGEVLPFLFNLTDMEQFSQFRNLGEKNKHVTGMISDRYTFITCQFSAECCNEWEAGYFYLLF